MPSGAKYVAPNSLVLINLMLSTLLPKKIALYMCNAVENIFIFILYDIYSHIPITLDELIFPLFFKKLIVQRIRVKSVSFRDLGTGGEINYVFYKMCNLAKYIYICI